jgi:hypothetical protein
MDKIKEYVYIYRARAAKNENSKIVFIDTHILLLKDSYPGTKTSFLYGV